ncbi:hypothetical protein F4810DRAFT_724648 [Camillea tinctor]|nr:hypothetical protein F4810DRAFT_724648 [Camillea tinctor]
MTTAGSNHRPFWNPDGVPGVADQSFKKHITSSHDTGIQPDPSHCRGWKNSPYPALHSSFGDQGTTATVNLYGDVIQLGIYLSKGRSGMFSADHGRTAEPYLVDDRSEALRAFTTSQEIFALRKLHEPQGPPDSEELHELRELSETHESHESAGKTDTYGLWFTGITFEDPPEMTWVNYRWPRFCYSLYHYKPWKVELAGANRTGSEIEIIVAYKMILFDKSRSNWEQLIIPASSVNVGQMLKNEFFCGSLSISTIRDAGKDDVKSINFKLTDPSGLPENEETAQNLLEFIVRRNLEHILSACSIPLKERSIRMMRSPVALTCGDMSFHRICTSASFFAFKFLLVVSKRLQQMLREHWTNKGLSALLNRVDEAYKGHFDWVYDIAEQLPFGFSANYWVIGKIMNQQSGSWRPNDSLIDTAFRLIKASLHLSMEKGLTFWEETELRLKPSKIARLWLLELERQDRRACYAWPHVQEADTNIFRLDVNVWIWNAIKTLDDLGVINRYKLSSEGKEPKINFKPDNVRREMLSRFTTQNENSAKRMLARSQKPNPLHKHDLHYTRKHNTHLKVLLQTYCDLTRYGLFEGEYGQKLQMAPENGREIVKLKIHPLLPIV